MAANPLSTTALLEERMSVADDPQVFSRKMWNTVGPGHGYHLREFVVPITYGPLEEDEPPDDPAATYGLGNGAEKDCIRVTSELLYDEDMNRRADQ
jgi:hypothetical protein